MTDKDASKDNTDEEDWMSYANAGFGSTDYSLWDDAGQEAELAEEPEWNDENLQLDTGEEEIPAAPKPAGLKHLVRIGCCDHCLGRIGGKKRFGQSDLESGIEIRASVVEADSTMANARENEPLCPFCENLFEEAPLLAELIYESIGERDCSRLQLGARIPKDQTEAEDHLRKRFGAGGSAPLKSSLVEEVARQLGELGMGQNLVVEKPEILALIDVLTLTVELDIRSHYVYGRYRKLERGIPQTKWPCRACKGRGCEKCDYTGLQYSSSVQALIGDPLLELFGSEEHAFHGMGREDIDVRCLGRGRPFVIELKKPYKRDVDMNLIMDAINSSAENRLEVSDMRPSNRSEVVRVKDTPAEKSYTIRYKIEPITQSNFDELTQVMEIPSNNQDRNKRRKNHHRRRKPEPEPEVEIDYSSMKKAELVELCEQKGLAKSGTKDVLIERLSTFKEATLPLPEKDYIMEIMTNLQGCTLAQRTPERVAHRRADKIRKRKVLETSNPSIKEDEDGNLVAEFSLRCESGTYVKETVHGDGGRTQPSIASLIKAKCTVEWLDVADIHAD
ncbi:MAG: tRNA pseudouridine(54/55) synthase Pus10 [Euryarchaeota archaeon]|jgi:tRNA pseudouridine synthase 10|nr:tRNA pseudouridine(54/55) synthase Pus10 [Euryarchaeota archaeon]|tara:strand:+ start:2424 stop:4106 length:1683 start_codon:yes stop_codon:yes gene_type:complete